jgi:hypothetical protein
MKGGKNQNLPVLDVPESNQLSPMLCPNIGCLKVIHPDRQKKDSLCPCFRRRVRITTKAVVE